MRKRRPKSTGISLADWELRYEEIKPEFKQIIFYRSSVVRNLAMRIRGLINPDNRAGVRNSRG